MGRPLLARALVLAPLVALLTIQCAMFGPPGWVNTSPTDDEYIYGVGSAGVTFDGNPARSQEIAHQRALDVLARQVRVRVISDSQLVESSSSTSFFSSTVQFTDEDLKGIELVKVWIDEWGRAGKAHQTYVLLRIPRDRAWQIAARS